MSNGDVQFHEWRPPRYTPDETPKIVHWVISHSGGLIKNTKQAQYVLLGFVVLSAAISFFLLYGWNQAVDTEKFKAENRSADTIINF